MLVNIVTAVNEALTVISRGVVHVAVYREGNRVVVVSSKFCNDQPYIPYNTETKDENSAICTANRLIGELVCEPLESFYWEEVDFNKHVRNGNPQMCNNAWLEDISNLVRAEIVRLVG